jgi:hypothetical protein
MVALKEKWLRAWDELDRRGGFIERDKSEKPAHVTLISEHEKPAQSPDEISRA